MSRKRVRVFSDGDAISASLALCCGVVVPLAALLGGRALGILESGALARGGLRDGLQVVRDLLERGPDGGHLNAGAFRSEAQDPAY